MMKKYLTVHVFIFLANFIVHQIKRRYSCNLQIHGLRCFHLVSVVSIKIICALCSAKTIGKTGGFLHMIIHVLFVVLFLFGLL